MKGFKSNFKVTAAILAVVTLLFGTSCSKDDTAPAQKRVGEVKALTDKNHQDKVSELVRKSPAISWYNSTMNKIITIDPNSEEKSFNFSDPNPGWNFSSAEGTVWQPSPYGGGILFIGPGSFGGNAGGTVVAGNSTLNINHTFCFSASDEALGLDLFDFGDGPEFTGISGVIGIAGDFDALVTGEFDEDDDIFEYFQGLAFYIVYDNEANGNYPILNWFDDLDESDSFFQNKGFAWVFAFNNPAGIYFSKNGNLSVSGGSMTFQGTYFGLQISDFDLDGYDDFDFVEVEGFGTMGCN